MANTDRDYRKAYLDLHRAAQSLLTKIDNITTDDFSKGGERIEREHLRRILDRDVILLMPTQGA